MSDEEPKAADRFALIGRFGEVWGNAMVAALEKFAAEMSEAAKNLPQREYWRGYEDGMKDAAELDEKEEAG